MTEINLSYRQVCFCPAVGRFTALSLTVWTKIAKTNAHSVLQHAYFLPKKNDCSLGNERTCIFDHLLCQLQCFLAIYILISFSITGI